MPLPPFPPPRDVLKGEGPQRRPQKRLDRRLEEVAKAVGGGYCRLQMPLKLALGVGETVAGHRLGGLEGGGGGFQCISAPPPPAPHAPRPRPLALLCVSPKVIKSLEPAPSLRHLYVLMIVRQQPIILTLLLYAVTQVIPPLADTAGGTKVEVYGEGFVPELDCQMQAGLTTRATFVGPNLMLCETAPTNTSATDCQSEVCPWALIERLLPRGRL